MSRQVNCGLRQQSRISIGNTHSLPLLYLLGFQGQCKDACCFGSRRTGARVGCRALAIEIRGGHASVGILGPVAERGGQRGAAALVVVGILSVVDGAVNGNSPHRSRIAVAVAIVLLAAIPRCPHIDVAESIAALQVASD